MEHINIDIKKDQNPERQLNGKPLEVSIAVIFYNEEDQICDFVNSILDSLVNTQNGAQSSNQTSSIRYDWILVDNASQDRSVELFCKILNEKNQSYQLIRNKVNNMGQARQLALDNCRADWIYFTDLDCRPQSKVLLTLLSQAKNEIQSNPSLAAIGGGNELFFKDTEWCNRAIYFLQRNTIGHLNSTQMKLSRGCEFVSHLSTCNVLYRLSALKLVGGFDSRMIRVGEDLDLSFRLQKNSEIHFNTNKKFLMLVNHEARVTHIVNRPGFNSWIKKIIKYGEAQPLIARRYPEVLITKRGISLWTAFLIPIILIYNPMLFLGLWVLTIILFISFYLIDGKNWGHSDFSFKSLIITGFMLQITQVSYLVGIWLGVAKIFEIHKIIKCRK